MVVLVAATVPLLLLLVEVGAIATMLTVNDYNGGDSDCERRCRTSCFFYMFSTIQIQNADSIIANY